MSENKKIMIIEPEVALITIKVKGLTPFISHRMDVDFRDTKPVKKELSPKELDDMYEKAVYRTADTNRAGIPAAAFMKALVEAASGKGWFSGSNISGKSFKGGVQIVGAPVLEMIGERLKEKRRIDVVRLSGPGRPPSLAYRPSFIDWECKIPLSININLLSVEDVMKVFGVAGLAIGVGDWRPQRGGNFGMFKIISAEEGLNA